MVFNIYRGQKKSRKRGDKRQTYRFCISKTQQTTKLMNRLYGAKAKTLACNTSSIAP